MAVRTAPRPFSSQDIDPDAYEAMIRQHKADLAARLDNQAPEPALAPPSDPDAVPPLTPEDLAAVGDAFSQWQKGKPVGHPGFVESLVPFWGSGREALADLQEKNYGGAALNAALAASDVVPADAVLKLGAEVGFKTAAKSGSTAWKAVRYDLGNAWDLKLGQPVHHWAIPQGRWGREVPDWIKNHPWNLKVMRDTVTHNKVHGIMGEKKYSPLMQYWYGTPGWWKANNFELFGKGVDWATDPKRPAVANTNP